MVLNDVKLYFASGAVDSAAFTKANCFAKLASCAIPEETLETVERTFFNSDHLKKFGVGYGEMGEITVTVDLDADSATQINTIDGYKNTRTEISLGFVVDETLSDLNVACSGFVTAVNRVDGDMTPGANATASFTFKPNTKLSAFTEPT